MDRLSVLCFGGTYGLALACDLARFAVRGSARWYATLALTALAWVVRSAYLGGLAIRTGPVAGLDEVFESLLVLSWVLAAVGHLPDRPGPEAGGGRGSRPAGGPGPGGGGRRLGPRGRTGQLGLERGGAVLGLGAWPALPGGAVASCVAFAAGLMYLAQSDRLKHKRPPRFGLKLPALRSRSG